MSMCHTLLISHRDFLFHLCKTDQEHVFVPNDSAEKQNIVRRISVHKEKEQFTPPSEIIMKLCRYAQQVWANSKISKKLKGIKKELARDLQ